MQHTESFAFVTVSYAVEIFKIIAEEFRVVDVLEEKLGNLNSFPMEKFKDFEMIKFSLISYRSGSINRNYYLKSKQIIPKKLVKEIDQKTSSIMENGLHRFYETFATFLRKIRSEIFLNDFDTGEIPPVSMEQMSVPIISLFALLALAGIVFSFEFMFHKFMVRRNRPVLRPFVIRYS